MWFIFSLNINPLAGKLKDISKQALRGKEKKTKPKQSNRITDSGEICNIK